MEVMGESTKRGAPIKPITLFGNLPTVSSLLIYGSFIIVTIGYASILNICSLVTTGTICATWCVRAVRIKGVTLTLILLIILSLPSINVYVDLRAPPPRPPAARPRRGR